MLAAVRAGRKTVTRRRISTGLPIQEDPGRYRYQRLEKEGALFEDLNSASAPWLLVPCPFGQPDELLRVAEDPSLTLKISSVSAEQVRCITVAGTLAEGLSQREKGGHKQWGGVEPDLVLPRCFCWYNSPIAAFHALLNSIYPGAWDRNEWVWVVKFA